MQEDAPAVSKAEATPYSAVVYVHGMGSQRRFEETSRLVDRLDAYLVNEHQRGNPLGMLIKVTARVEPSRTRPAEIVSYIRSFFSATPKVDWSKVTQVRFFEIYWAPVMAGEKSPWRVLQWILAQQLRPWRTLRAPWRERQRLRRAALVALFEERLASGQPVAEGDYAKLVGLYDDFERLDSQRDFPQGSFKQFLAFIAEENAKRPETAKRLVSLARAWRETYLRRELGAAFTLITLGLTLLLLAGAAMVAILQALHGLGGIAPLGRFLDYLDIPLKADWQTASGVAVSLFLLLGLGRFLTDYIGDVEAWATYEETDEKHEKRARVIDQGVDTLTHVLSDPRCNRVTVVSHSLGTSIAHDTLLALAKMNRARNPQDPIAGPVPLLKIEHFVTMGSPIDKIEYFFESYSSASHRYKRMVEALRGDIGSDPFARNHKPHIHWLNFWDEGDPISGALHSPANPQDFLQRVDNVHAASFAFPVPGASHSGYFDNRAVIGTLFNVIYHRALSFETLPLRPGKGYNYQSVFQGPGDPRGDRRIYLLLAAAAPWLALAGLASWILGARPIAYAALAAAGLAALGLIAGYAYSRARGHRQPL
jgi:hypothetical protein